MAPNAPSIAPIWPQTLRWVCLSLGLAPLVVAQAGWAQENTNPLSDFRPTAEQRSGGFARSGNGLSVFDIIHRSRLGNLDMDAFSQEQQQNLDAAAAEFRKRQRERLGTPQVQPMPVLPESSEPSL
ncbi:hypothetical protein OOK60_04485 [Trichothermofontia sichuanensis B231]|uniref:hypothetical protein n=1 Tax=Trichothermofontia sichuanensis TaxID=3045816 RepID=UPI0022460894|nr:hypothetical protein [Trichothermofontia sichuanensis]UZQ55337.1 hypothetical protein OOK60_04485 [Trichothermofontia sichuanensis B231]